MTNREWTIAAELPDETACLRLEEFCARLQVEQQWITELVAIGALEATMALFAEKVPSPLPTEKSSWSRSLRGTIRSVLPSASRSCKSGNAPGESAGTYRGGL